MNLRKENGVVELRRTIEEFRAEIRIMRENLPAIFHDSVNLDSLWRACDRLEERFQALEEYLDKQEE